MLEIDKDGMVINNARILPKRTSAIERAPMAVVKGIIVHQTGSSTEQAVFNSYMQPGANGAHFLISKQGTIYQTASLYRRTNHVGNVRARCLAEHSCSAAEIKQYAKSGPKATNRLEMVKSVPARYPSNQDSIGIEIVGIASLPPEKKMPANLTPQKQQEFINNNAVYEAVNGPQQSALSYLIEELKNSLQVPGTEIHRHPAVSYKNATEAASATW
jgi:N-acetyl-anhydromuramyl-L-alanine amidase AmpD